LVVAWASAADADKAAVLSDTQLKLRQAGIGVLGPDEKSVVNWPTLFIGISLGTTAVPLIVELTEEAYMNRDIVASGKYAASAAYLMWYQERSKNPSPIKDEEKHEHMAPMLAESKENAALPFSAATKSSVLVKVWPCAESADGIRAETHCPMESRDSGLKCDDLSRASD
jgi:hypothetical protein